MTAPARPTKAELLAKKIHTSTSREFDVSPLVDSMRSMAFSARDLARPPTFITRMLDDKECGVILCLAGSLISAGLKQVFVDLVRNNMVDAIVSTGARTSSIKTFSRGWLWALRGRRAI